MNPANNYKSNSDDLWYDLFCSCLFGSQTQGTVSSSTSQPTSPVPPDQPISTHVPHQKLNVNDLLAVKLHDPSKQLNFEDSIALMTACIRQGEIQASQAVNQELIILIGNTGAGKSTFGNYASGCTMVRKHPGALGITGMDHVVVVKPVSEGGQLDEIMPIGHSKKSMTFMPRIMTTRQGLTLCDCPGFLDNRGIEINIANAVNIKNAFIRAKGIKVVMLINYHTLKADRARGLTDMIKICSDLFGSKENLIRYQDSILLGITQVPKASSAEDRDEQPLSLQDLKEWIADTDLQDHFANQTLRCLSERVFIYDPFDNLNLKFSGAWNRETILESIRRLKPINSPRSIFRTVLTENDQFGLFQMCEKIKARILQLFPRDHLSESNFELVARYQGCLNQLEIIEHHQVTKLVAETRGFIISQFNGIIHDFERRCSDTTSDLSRQSEEFLIQLKNGIRHFDHHIQSNVNIAELESRCDLYKKRFLATESAKNLLGMERTFRTYCQETNFYGAQQLLGQIRQKLREFDQQFSQTGIAHSLDVSQLDGYYQKSKQIYEQNQAREQERERRIAEEKMKVLAERKRQEEYEKKIEAERKRQAEYEQTRIQEEYRRNEEQRQKTLADAAQRLAKVEAELNEILERQRKEEERQRKEQEDVDRRRRQVSDADRFFYTVMGQIGLRRKK